MTTVITLKMPRGPYGPQQVDLDELTPKARALAEAIAQTGLARVQLRSVGTLRDQYASTRDAEFIHGAGNPLLDLPTTSYHESWMAVGNNQNEDGTPKRTIREILEWEARKFPGWYPIADDDSDLPSSQLARLDDGIDADRALMLLSQLGRPVDKDTWMRRATKGLDGYPAPMCHNGRCSLWSERAVRDYADPLGAAHRAYKLADTTRRAAVLAALEGGMSEHEVARRVGVTRQTVRSWAGK